MMLEPTATFIFGFRGIISKDAALSKLKTFLHDKKWLPVDSEYNSSLIDYHTEADGSCVLVLKKIDGHSVEELADVLFSNLCDTEDVKYVKVLYNANTAKLVYNHSGKYYNRQEVDLSELKSYDKVVILYRK